MYITYIYIQVYENYNVIHTCVVGICAIAHYRARAHESHWYLCTALMWVIFYRVVCFTMFYPWILDTLIIGCGLEKNMFRHDKEVVQLWQDGEELMRAAAWDSRKKTSHKRPWKISQLYKGLYSIISLWWESCFFLLVNLFKWDGVEPCYPTSRRGCRTSLGQFNFFKWNLYVILCYLYRYIYIFIYIAKKKHETVGFEQETRGFEQQVEETAMIHQCNEGTYLYSWS